MGSQRTGAGNLSKAGTIINFELTDDSVLHHPIEPEPEPLPELGRVRASVTVSLQLATTDTSQAACSTGDVGPYTLESVNPSGPKPDDRR